MKTILFLLASLFAFESCAAVKPLPPAQAFVTSASVRDPNTVDFTWQMPKGYFLYRDRIHITSLTPTNFTLGKLHLPHATFKSDPELGRFAIYRDQLKLPLSVLGQVAGPANLLVEYQGCTDAGFCYPPVMLKLALTFDENHSLKETNIEAYELPSKPAPPAMSLNANDLLQDQHMLLAILVFWGLGILLAFTPCILPMIPVLSGIIIGHGDKITTKHAFLLSLTYVLGMSVTYALVGVVIATLGANLQIMLQNPWVISVFALFFVALAFSMFGFYELTLPTRLQARFAKLSYGTKGGSYFGVAIMGSLSTLILSPCVTPPLVGVLGYVASSGNVLFGASALFFLSLGMGTPLLFIGTSAGRWLPKAGMWMNHIKNLLGVLLLAIAINLVSRIIPGPATLSLWAALLILSGCYLGALSRTAKSWSWLQQGFGIILLIYGLLCLAGASLGHDDVFEPLAGFNLTTPNTSKHANSVTIRTPDELQTQLTNAKGNIVILDFYADWCIACKVIDRTVFRDLSVQQALESVILLRVDVTANDDNAKAIMQKYGVIAPPTLVWLDKNGQTLSNETLVGEFDKATFLKTIGKLVTANT